MQEKGASAATPLDIAYQRNVLDTIYVIARNRVGRDYYPDGILRWSAIGVIVRLMSANPTQRYREVAVSWKEVKEQL